MIVLSEDWDTQLQPLPLLGEIDQFGSAIISYNCTIASLKEKQKEVLMTDAVTVARRDCSAIYELYDYASLKEKQKEVLMTMMLSIL